MNTLAVYDSRAMVKKQNKRDPIAVEMGRRLRQLRKAREWSQSDLARHSGLTPSAIGNYEQGTRRIRQNEARALGEALSIPAAYIMTEISEEEAHIIGTIRKHRIEE